MTRSLVFIYVGGDELKFRYNRKKKGIEQNSYLFITESAISSTSSIVNAMRRM